MKEIAAGGTKRSCGGFGIFIYFKLMHGIYYGRPLARSNLTAYVKALARYTDTTLSTLHMALHRYETQPSKLVFLIFDLKGGACGGWNFGGCLGLHELLHELT